MQNSPALIEHSRFAGTADRAAAHSPARRAGFTVLELLTVIGIISTLAALILPAVGSAREAARRMQCVNQLKQVGLALHSYHDGWQTLPPGWQWESSQQSAYGWLVPLLPQLEQESLFYETDRNVPLNPATNTTPRATSLNPLLCPSDLTEPVFTLYWDDDLDPAEPPLVKLPTASYVGVFGTLEPDEEDSPPGDGAFIESQPIRFADLQRGLTNTFVVGERTMVRVTSTWLGFDRRGDDAQCRLVGNALTSPNCDECDECEFDSRHPGGANFLWGDGHVSFVSDSIDSQEYQTFAKRSDD